MKKSLSILPGKGKDGTSESFEVLDLRLGEVISIVGPTGSGKTALITDIELMSQGDSITDRRILIDGEIPSDEIRYNPIHKPIAMITQNTKCFSDLYVEDFLKIHARARGIDDAAIIEECINLANKFTGEEVKKNHRVTELSGGQTRSLMFADAIKIGSAPIILLDEIENAGINKNQIINSIIDSNKLIIFVTHDPIIALQTGKRIIMKNGIITKVIANDKAEDCFLEDILNYDKMMNALREKLRRGEVITEPLIKITDSVIRTCEAMGETIETIA